MSCPFFLVEDNGAHRAVVMFEGPKAQLLLMAFLRARAKK